MTVAHDPLVGQVPEELDRMRRLYQERKPRRVLEIGVWHGGTLREWLAGDPEIVVAVDEAPQVTEFEMGEDTKLIFLVGRSQSDTIKEAIRLHAPYDWVFIDGDHAYGPVDADAQLALEVTQPGSVILLHDIVYDAGSGSIGPQQVFEELAAAGYETWQIVEDAGPSGYPATNAHGIGIVEV